MPDGMGNLLFHPLEDLYVGQFDNGLKHDLGKYTYMSGGGSAHHPFSIPYYAGEWFADSYHGLGKHLITEFENLMIYEGTHTHDKKTGFGTYKKFNSDNVDKFCNTELIGYFLDGQGHEMIIEINRKDNMIKIKAINMIKKHLKPTKENKGGIVSKEDFIHQSNIKNLDLNKKEIKEKGKK